MSKGLQHAKEILGEYNLQTVTALKDPRTSHHILKPFNLNGPRKSPNKYLQHQANPPPPTTTFEFDGMIWTKKHGATMPPTNKQLNPDNPTDATAPPTTQWVAMPRDAYAYAPGDAPIKPKSATEWHRKSRTSGQLSSALMNKKSTPQWQTPKSTPQWQTSKSTPQWQMSKSTPQRQTNPNPALARQSLQIAPFPMPKMTHPSLLHLASEDIWPSDLIDIIRAIIRIPPRQPTPPEFSFKLTNKAAKKNYLVLMHKYKGNLAASLESQRNSTVGKTPYPTYLHAIPIGIK